jgi:hypothetical protein
MVTSSVNRTPGLLLGRTGALQDNWFAILLLISHPLNDPTTFLSVFVVAANSTIQLLNVGTPSNPVSTQHASLKRDISRTLSTRTNRSGVVT